MLSLRCVGICLIALAFASSPLPLPAATTTVINPRSGAGSAGGTATVPPVAPGPVVPGSPPAPVGTLPGVIAPAPPAAVAPVVPGPLPPPPQGTPLPEGSEPEKSVVQIF